MSNIVIEKFIAEVNRDIDRNQLLGENERAFMLSKCVQIILLLEHQLDTYGLPIPAEQIASVARDKR